VIARLRAHGERFGSASQASMAKHDPGALRSVRLHFTSFDEAREAAGVRAAPRARRTGTRRPSKAVWSHRRVVRELRRRERGGQSTGWAELMSDGHADLVGAAAVHAGGLARARDAARVAAPERRMPVPRWSKDTIASTIRERARTGATLASSKVPQRFVAAARWHFGSWEAALAAADVNARETRLQRPPYTKEEIVALLRQLAQDGKPLRASTLKEVVKVDTVRRLFGSVARAVRAAGLVPSEHANQKWSRARVIEALQARAAQGEVRMPRGLQSAVQQYFGGAHAAREAAGLPPALREAWTRASLIEELRHRARGGDSGRTLWAACKRLFGSVAAARRAAKVPAAQRSRGMVAWSKAQLLAELGSRVRSGEQLSRGLTAGLRRAFGSLVAARALAGVSTRREVARAATEAGVDTAKREAWRRWTREQVIAKLQAWSAAGGPLRLELSRACAQQFGSVGKAVAAAKVPVRTAAWTPQRVRKALRAPGGEPLDPGLVAACIDHFGSVTAARAAAVQRSWSKAKVIAELQARARRGLTGVGRLLREPAVRLFGSTDAALRAAQAEQGGAIPRSRVPAP
jgi:hypothetical protein